MRLFNESKGNDLDLIASEMKHDRSFVASWVFGTTEERIDRVLTEGAQSEKDRIVKLAVEQVLFVMEWLKVTTDGKLPLIGVLNATVSVIYDRPPIEIQLMYRLGDPARLLTTDDIDAAVGNCMNPTWDIVLPTVGDRVECVDCEEQLTLRYDRAYTIMAMRTIQKWGTNHTEVQVRLEGGPPGKWVHQDRWWEISRFRKLESQPPVWPELSRG